jgi:outer membrane protein TolC
MKIYESALSLVERNLKINESLLKNGKGLSANVLRAESELESVRSKLKEAENQVRNARSWFNFLLNRSVNDSIVYESIPLPDDLESKLLSTPVVENRSELKALGTVGEIRSLQLDLNQRYAIPKINAFADLGSQAFNWEFNSKTRYLLAGFQLTIPIFSGLRNRVKIADTRLEIDDILKQQELAGNQFTVAANVSRNNLNTAAGNFSSAEKQFRSAKAYFNLIEKGYSQGINSLIEYMDARNQLTSSEIHVKLNRYKVLGAYADLKRETAGK